MIHYLEPDSHIRDKFKVILNHATKKELGHATGVDIPDLAAEKISSSRKLKLTN